MNIENKRTIFEEKHFTEANYPFTIKQNFSTLDSIIEIFRQEPLTSFLPDDSIRNPLWIDASTIYGEYNLLPNTVEILSIDNVFLETIISRGLNFKGKQSVLIANFTMDVDPGYKNIEKFKGGIQW